MPTKAKHQGYLGMGPTKMTSFRLPVTHIDLAKRVAAAQRSSTTQVIREGIEAVAKNKGVE